MSSQICLDLKYPLGGVTSWNASVKFWQGRGPTMSSQICLDLKYPLGGVM